jgi:hypothetical protein
LFSTTAALPTANDTTALTGYQHLTADGWLTPVVNPHSYGVEGNQSAEAQAFVIQLHAAHRDWVLAGSKTTSAALPDKMLTFGAMWVAAATTVLIQIW